MTEGDGSFLSMFIGWIYVSAIALFGILVRVGQTAAAEGALKWREVWIAALTAPGLGIIANGLALWMYPKLPSEVLAGLIGMVGFLGPAFVLTIASKIAQTWAGRSGVP